MAEEMTEVWFYHLERTGLEQALPELLEKTLQRGWKAVVRVRQMERAAIVRKLRRAAALRTGCLRGFAA